MAKTKGRISKKQLLPLVKKGLGTREIGKRLDRGPTSIRYWLKVYSLKTSPSYHTSLGNLPRRCACGETRVEMFYGRKKTVCAKCHNTYTLRLGQEKKDKARELLGGKCAACGFNKYKSSLAIHHKNPAVKDSDFRSMRGWNWDRIEKEIKECILLCHNCHGAYHSGELKINFTRV